MQQGLVKKPPKPSARALTETRQTCRHCLSLLYDTAIASSALLDKVLFDSMRSAVLHQAMRAPKGNQKIIFGTVGAVLAICSLPFFSKAVLDKEQKLAEMRDSSYDAKDEARNQRLRVSRSA